MKKLSVLLIAALLLIALVKSSKASDVEFTVSCGCQTSTPSPTPTPIPTPTPTPLPSRTPDPTPSPTPFDVCPNLDGIQTSVPDNYHLDTGGKNCIQFEMGGAPPPPPVNTTKTQVLGASTTVLAATGSTDNHVNPSILMDGPSNLIIPKLNLDLAVSPSKVEGNNWEVFDDRAAWLKTSALPGSGNTIIYTHKRPGLFMNLYKLKIGDDIKIYKNKWFTYKVSNVKIIKPSDTTLILSNKNQLVLFTCSGSFDQSRLVVYAE